MENISIYVYGAFGLIVFALLTIFYLASQKSKSFIYVTSGWILFQSILSLSNFYIQKNIPIPRFPFLIVPGVAFIIFLFNTKKGKLFIDSLNLKLLTLIHIIRIPIELILFNLFLNKLIPQIMTFEGRNFDIISGITAPFIYYFGFVNKKLRKTWIVIWNIICLGLLFNIVVYSILSSPTLFQRFGFEQPNIAILHFPFLLLPSLIVPIILFSHLASIRKLIGTLNDNINIDQSDSANVMIFPPLLFFVGLLLSLIISYFFPYEVFSKKIGLLIGLIVNISGYLILRSSAKQLKTHQTTIHPKGKTTRIVNKGIYGYSRNPIYLSFIALYLGTCIMFNSWSGILLLIPLLFVLQKGIVEREESYLLKKFGKEYLTYKNKVNRWI